MNLNQDICDCWTQETKYVAIAGLLWFWLYFNDGKDSIIELARPFMAIRLLLWLEGVAAPSELDIQTS